MNVHKNAKLTPAGRALLVERVLTQRQRWAVVAVGFGVSKRTVGKWVRRWQAEGNVGLRDRSSRPHHCPRQVPGRVVRWIERLRRHRRTGPEIATVVGLPVATVGLVLRRLGLSRLRALEPRGRPLRYQRASAGELVHIDSKRFVRFRQVGHRIHGERARRSRRVGFEHLHVCVDDATRLAYTELLAADDAASAVGFLGRAAAWFGRLGVQIERVMTDNAFAYTSHALSGGAARNGRAPSPDASVHAPHQREGGALHPDLSAGMGVSAPLPQLGRAGGSLARFHPALQRRAAAHLAAAAAAPGSLTRAR